MIAWADPDPRRVFVDTSAFFALTDRRSSDFKGAQEIERRLVQTRAVLFTTNFVVAETHALLVNRLNRWVALAFLESIEQAGISLVRVDIADEHRAREIIIQYDDKDFTLTDATSFAVMERLRIIRAFTLDQHFAQYGFRLFGR